MNKYATKVFGSLQSCGASPEIIRDAKGKLNKIRGTRTLKIKEGTPENPDPKEISVAQLSYENKKAHFTELIGLVKNETLYKPNEDELKAATLEAYIDSLTSLNDAVVTNLQMLKSKIDDRNEELYAPVTGLSELVGSVKSYVKSVVGTQDPVYKRIAGVRITKPKGYK